MNLSLNYLEQLQQLHSDNRIGFGTDPPPTLIIIIESSKIETVIDYGCGTGKMISTLKESYPTLNFIGYDPAVEEYSNIPESADLLYSTDVLEHFEPEFVDEGISNILTLANIQYHYIACHPAKKLLPDGRNCHLIIEEPRWWLQKFLNITDNKWSIKYFRELTFTKKQVTKISCEIFLMKNE